MKTVYVNGKAVKPARVSDAVEVEPGIHSVILDGCCYELAITGSEIAVNGLNLAVQVEDPRKWNPAGASRKAGGKEAVKAPMPGKVLRILIGEGDTVVAGQGLIVVEAMKMQNEMKAPRAGRITGIAVKEHDTVSAGLVLLQIE